MSVAIPAATGGSISPARFAVTAIGAGFGISLGAQKIIPAIPDKFAHAQIGPLDVYTSLLGACALLGAAAANMAFNALD